MQRKISILIVLLMAWAGCAYGQSEQHKRSIDRAISLYNFGHCIEARTELLVLRTTLSPVTDKQEIERVDYYLALCDADLKMAEADERLKRFLAEYPGSIYSNEIHFTLATRAFVMDDTELAESSLAKVNYKTLSPSQRNRYDLRMGYSAFLAKDYEGAEKYFDRMATNSEYSEHVTYYKSYIAYTKGEYSVAREGFSSLLKSAQYSDLMPFYMLQIDFKEGKYREVVERGKALIATTTDDQIVQINRIMAESWFQLDDFGQAVECMSKYKAGGGQMGRVENYILGYSLHRKTLYNEAAPYLREACGADDMLTQNASYHLADCYLRQGDKTNAMHSFAMASNAQYDASIAEDALFNYGCLQYELGGHFNEAINVLGRYVAQYPNSERVSDARSLLIAAYYNSKNYQQAYDALKQLPDLNNDEMLALQKIAFFNGLEAYSEGELDRAEASFQESLSAGSNAKYSALTSFWLGEVAFARGEKGIALQRYRNFISRAPKGSNEAAMAQYNLGYCYFDKGDMASAGKAFDAFLLEYRKSDAFRADAMNRRGDIYYSMRQFSSAIQCYDKSMAMRSLGSDYAEYQRAITLGVQNQRAKKIEALKRIVQADKGDYVDDAQYELGHTYIADEQYDNGVRTLESFVAQYPNSKYYTQALSELGLAYMNLGQKDKALVYYDLVVKAAPKSSESKSALQGIREIYVDKGDVESYFDYTNKVGVAGDVNALERDSLSYAAAQKLYLDNRTADAVVGFKNYLNNYPEGNFQNDALFFLSDCYVRDGREAEAIETLSKLADQGRTQYSERVLDRLSSMCYKSERWELAAKSYRRLYDESADASVRKSAASGYVASTLKYADDDAVVAMADDVEKFEIMTDIARRKARHAKAQVMLRKGDEQAALEIFKVLNTEVKSAEGAEARFRIIEAEYNAKHYDKAEKMVYEFSDSNTPQNYWLAKAFILLGDIYVDKGDSFQARATYQSIVDGYSPADDGVVELAKSRIAKLN